LTVATQTEQLIQALTNELTILKERVEALRVETQPIRDITNQIAVIEHKLAEMTKTKEIWGQRGWMILKIILSALFSFLGVILGALVTHYLKAMK
jgi:hypothetical protein